MLIIPAIDLMAGKVVRLYKGRKEEAKVYSAHPVDVARNWRKAGVSLIHVVDLDAAFGEGSNEKIIAQIAEGGGDIEVGGGIRTLEKAEQLFDMGVKRVILGTKAADFDFLQRMIARFPGKVMVGVDVLNGKFMSAGWKEKTEFDFINFVTKLVGLGVEWIIYTDISRDGTMQGSNLEESKKLGAISGAKFIISGGVGSMQDLLKIKQELPFAYGVIAGKAVYEGTVDVALAAAMLK